MSQIVINYSMKKRLFLVLAILFLMSSIFLIACDNKKDIYFDNISELRTDVFRHTDDIVDITAMSGQRETNFAIDGLSHNKVEFTVVKVSPVNGIEVNAHFDYQIKIDSESFTGQLLKHPFNESFSIEIPKATNGNNLILHLSSEDYQADFELVTKFSKDMINYKKALEIASKKLSNRFASLTVDKKLNAEIFIRLVEDPRSPNDNYYWYVALVDNARNTYAVLIDPINETVLTTRE